QQGVLHAIWRVDDVWRGGAFYADAAVGVFGIGIDGGEPAVFDGCNHAAARCAHRAVGWKFLGRDLENLLGDLLETFRQRVAQYTVPSLLGFFVSFREAQRCPSELSERLDA